MRKLSLLLIVLLLTTTLPAFAIGSSVTELYEAIESFVAEHEATTAAVSIAVFNSHDVLFEQAYGYINIAEDSVNDFDVVFEWGSTTKLIVSVSAMQLAEQGRLDLSADIRTYLPNGFLTGLAYDDTITMLHLLNHTAGFQESIRELHLPQISNFRPLGEALQVLQPVQINRPGEVIAYSNFGMALAGYIIEQIAGQPFYAYVHEHIFAPLGMTQTALLPDLSDNPWVRAQRAYTHCYTTNLQSLGVMDFGIQWYPTGMATGTISDLRKFGQALLPDADGMSPLFGSAQTLQRLHTPTFYYPDGITSQNHHGFWTEPYLYGTVIGHGGNTLGMTAALKVDVEHGLGLVVMTNQAGEQIFNRQMSRIIFGDADFTQMGNSANDVRVSGVFRSAQSFRRGIFRPLALLDVPNTIPIFQQDDTTLSVPIFGNLYSVAPGVYRSDESAMISNLMLFVSAGENGIAQSFTIMVSEFTKTSWAILIFEIIALLLFVISGFYGLLALIWHVVQRLCKKEQLLSLYCAFISTAAFLALVNFVLFFFIGMPTATSLTMIRVHGIVFILLSPVILVCAVVLLMKMRASTLSKRQKRQTIRVTIMGAFTLLNVIYWQLWMFWV